MSMVPPKTSFTVLARNAAALFLVLLLASTGRVDAQQTINACYVPDVGAVYLVGLPGLPTACLSPTHQSISWTSGGGDLADGSVTAIKLADGAVITVKLADGAVTAAKLAFDPATQAELDAHAGSADHDGRYYTETELNSAGTINATSNPVDWTRLKGVPADFADGVDDGGGVATDLDCTGCVGTPDIAAGAVTSATIATGAVTTAGIAAGAVASAEIADGTVTTTDLAFDPATQAELDTHAGSADHDGRYYTETELSSAGTINATSNPVDWTRLKGVPAGFADGVDDGGGVATDLDCTGCVGTPDIAAGAVTSATIATGAVTTTDLAFDPATQAELDTHAGSADHDGRYYTETELSSAGTINTPSNPVDWTRLKGVPADFADGVDDGASYTASGGIALTGSDFHLIEVCANGQLLKWSGSDWVCADDLDTSDGTVTSITAGLGLTGGTITTSGVITVDFAGPGAETTVARSDHDHSLASSNTAIGELALVAPTGAGNTAVGRSALSSNTSGPTNTALGASALQANLDGYSNTGVGSSALLNNTSGGINTAVGQNALLSNVLGNSNTAVGARSLDSNTGGGNTGVGVDALGANTTGDSNTAVGLGALQTVDGGNQNVGIGYLAGNGVTTGSNNIHIGAQGFGTDDGVIRIGNGQTETYVAGINGQTSSGGVAVYINSAGQLGTMTSSIRFKEDVVDLGAASRPLLQLRPVRFRYKPAFDDGSRLIQYGLIAEEVEQVFPELVAYGADGRVQTVRYHLLSVLLLNELQRQEAELTELRGLKDEVEALAAELAALRQAVTESGRRD